MDSAEVGVLEEADHVGFGGLLEGKDGGGLESQVLLEGAGDVTDKSLEGELADEELGGLLELADLAEGDGTGSESVGAFNATGAGGLGGSSLGCDVLAWVLSTGRLAGGHLGACHMILNYSSLSVLA